MPYELNPAINAEVQSKHRKARWNGKMDDWALDYVRHVVAELGITATELASRARVSSSTITRPLNPESGHPYAISRRTLEKIRDATGIPFPSEATGPVSEPAPKRRESSGLITVPVYDVDASAGHGAMVLAEEPIDEVAFTSRFIRTMTMANVKSLSIIRVKGDSMEPTLLDGDQVLVDMSKTNLDFDGLFVIRYGEALHVKRVGRHRKRGWVTITSDNEQYRQIEAEYQDVDIVGRVLWFGRKV